MKQVGSGDPNAGVIPIPITANPEALFLADTKVMTRISSIHAFQFRVDYQKTAMLSDLGQRQRVINAGYGILNAVLKETNMHYWHVLEASEDPSENSIRFTYTHDRNHFQLRIQPNALIIERSSSSWSNFFSWYLSFMPMASRIESSFRKEIQISSSNTVTPVQSHYAFEFILTDLKKGGQQNPQRNLAVMAEILPNLPDGSGAKKPLAEQSFQRIDITVSKREVIAGKVRNAWYIIEAPFNDLGRALHCRFELRGTSFEELAGERVANTMRFDEDSLDDYSIALNEFLKVNAVERFLGAILGDDWNFESVREM